MSEGTLKARVAASEKQVKTLSKEREAQDTELAIARRRLFDSISELLQSNEVEDDESLVEKLWRLCFLKRIEDFRGRIETPDKGAKLKVIQEFRTFIAESMRLLKDLSDNIRTKRHSLSRVFTCLGDLARYKEQISAEEKKRWIEAEEYYREAARAYPELGLPQNQLAVLAFYRKRALVSAYRYERALACSKPFENARRNLESLLDNPCKDDGESKRTQDEFFLNCLLLHAAAILPKVENSRFETSKEFLTTIRSQFEAALLSVHNKGEVLSSLLYVFIFAITNGEALGRAVGESEKSRLSMDSFRAVACCFVDCACKVANAHAAHGFIDQTVSNISKLLLLTQDVCSFVRAFGLHLLDEDLKQSLEELDRSLTCLPLEIHVRQVESYELHVSDLVGFLPLEQRAKSLESHPTITIGDVARDVRAFVNLFLHTDLSQSASNGILYSTHKPGAPYEDDEEEEILFRPNFASHAPQSFTNGLSQSSDKLFASHLPPFSAYHPLPQPVTNSGLPVTSSAWAPASQQPPLGFGLIGGAGFGFQSPSQQQQQPFVAYPQPLFDYGGGFLAPAPASSPPNATAQPNMTRRPPGFST